MYAKHTRTLPKTQHNTHPTYICKYYDSKGRANKMQLQIYTNVFELLLWHKRVLDTFPCRSSHCRFLCMCLAISI